MGCNLDAENNIKMNLGHQWKNFSCFVDWKKAFDCVNWTKLMLIVRELIWNSAKENCSSNCTLIGALNTTGPRRHNKCEGCKISETRVLFVTDLIQLVGRITYQRISGSVWRL